MRAALGALLLAGLLGLSGCSAVRLGYSQGATLGWWWLSGFADFSDVQAPRVKSALSRWFDWHRRSELPRYRTLLLRAQQEVVADVTPAQVCGWADTLQSLRDAAVLPLAADVADLGATFTAPQRNDMAERFQRKNAEWRDDYLQPDLRLRERKAIERATDFAEKLYGRLHRPQRDLLASQVRAATWKPELALADREAHQRDTLATLEQLAQPGVLAAQAQALARAWLLRQGRPLDDEGRHVRERDLRYWCDATAELHNQTDAAQRRHAADTIRGWQQDVESFLSPS